MLSRVITAVKSERIFIRSLGYVVGGASIGHLLVVLASPVTTRLYNPSDFGLFGLILAYVGFFSSIGSLRYELAIVSADNEREACNLFVISIWLSLAMSFVAGGALYLAKAYSVLGYENIGYIFLPLLLVGVWATSLYSVFRIALIRHQEYRLVGHVSVVRNIVRVGGQILFGLLSLGAVGLFGSEILSRFSGMIDSWIALKRKMFPNGIEWSISWETAKKYRRFPLLSCPSSFLNSLGPIFQFPIITRLYGVEAAGHFVLVSNIFGMIVALVGQSLGEVSHGRFAELKTLKNNKMERFLLKLLVTLGGVAFVIILITWLLAPSLFPVIFGDEWLLAGTMAPWVALYAITSILVFPIDRIIYVNNWHSMKLFFNAIFLLAVVSVPWLAYTCGLNVLNAVVLLSAVLVINYLVYVAVVVAKIFAGCSVS